MSNLQFKEHGGVNSSESLDCPMTCNQALMHIFEIKLVGERQIVRGEASVFCGGV